MSAVTCALAVSLTRLLEMVGVAAMMDFGRNQQKRPAQWPTFFNRFKRETSLN